MKAILLVLATFIFSNSFGQTATIYGNVKKSDGTRIKGTSTMRGYEDQLIITNYTGGTDNTGSIEIEVPTYTYIAGFRNMINTAPPRPAVTKPVTTVIKPTTTPIVMPEKITVQSLQQFPISRVDVSVTSRVGNNLPTLTRQIILENVKVESCTDDALSGTSKIKLKAGRIGWIYISRDVNGKITTTSKSGWDTVAGTAWSNF